MIDKLKSYWIYLSSAGIALLYFLLTLSKAKSREYRLQLEQTKLEKELTKVKERAKVKKEVAENAKKNYKSLLDRHPKLKSYLDE